MEQEAAMGMLEGLRELRRLEGYGQRSVLG